MNVTELVGGLLVLALVTGCTRNKLEPKGFSVKQETETKDVTKVDGIAKDSTKLDTRPSSVLLTGKKQHRLATIYKVNFNKKTENTFIGSNYFYHNYTEIGHSNGNQWNYNFMPGLEAVYGYNMVNISHYDVKLQKRNDFFEKPVLIKTLYYPSFTRDTLYGNAVDRNYYLVSAYDEDTNKDGFINVHDLRHFYYFDINTNDKTQLIPKNYSVLSSEYDPANDFMFVFAKLDQNENGKGDDHEAIHIFWIDLKNPKNNGRQY